MKISKFIYRIKSNASIGLSGVLLLLFLATSCTEEENGHSLFTEEESTAFFDVSTRALGSGDALVNTVRVIVARQDNEGTIVSNTFVPDPKNSSIIVKTKSGQCDVFVVTNEMPDNSELSALRGVTTIQELQQVNIPYSISNRVSTNLPMKGEVRNVFIHTVDGVPSETNRSTVAVDGVSSSALEVNVKRLAIRVDLRLMSQSFAKLESVKITNIPDAVSLVGNVYEAVDANKQTKTVGDFSSPIPLTGYVWEKSKSEIYLPSSIFSPSTDASKAIKLEVKIEGKTTMTVVSLGHLMEKELNPKDYTLHPNTKYIFTGRILGDKLEISASIADWELVKQDYPTGGGKWVSLPSSIRVGINKVVADTARFMAEFLPVPDNYNWYRRYQEYDSVAHIIKTIIAPLNNVETDILSIKGANSSTLSIATKHTAVSGEVYCIASTTSPDGTVERSESNHVTYMVVGENYVWDKGTYPSMQGFKAPSNAPLGSTCILQDNRDNKLYHVKLMADGNWWMVQDLAYGNTVSSIEYDSKCLNGETSNLIADGLYGVCRKSDLATGGNFYNGYAVHQMKNQTYTDVDKGSNIEYVPGICPSGWHLPGNMANQYNKEWFIFVDMTGIQLAANDIKRFEYLNSRDFNAYTEEEAYASINFHGGVVTTKDGRFDPIVFRTMGITSSKLFPQIAGIIVDHVDNFKGYPYPVRCIKNYK